MSRRTIALLGAVTGGVLIGLGLVPLLDRPADAPKEAGRPPSADRTLAAELASLREELRGERAARAQLAEELAELRAELRHAAAPPEPPRVDTPEGAAAGGAEPAAPPGEAPRFDAGTLVAAGFSPREVKAFRARLDELELERLYLRDRATREDWIDAPRYAEESARLASARRATRDEFGEDLYDWMLYAMGHPNRLRISEIIADSPAAQVGLVVGDVIVRYADRRILVASELRESTTTGTAGEPTPVEVKRNGETLRLFVPRGPLGVRLQHIVEPPEPRR